MNIDVKKDPGSQHPRASALRPLQEQLFRALWIASVVSNVGTWMQEVGEAWLMTSLTNSPLLIGLLATAVTLPMFLFALPGGALADVMDRRRMLLFTQGWMTVTAALMALLALTGAMTPWLLLSTTFLLSIGAAMNGPAWQATIPELVPRADLPAAIALGSVGFNVARAIGPALGGIVVAVSGPWTSFLLNAVSFLGVIIVLYRWKRKHNPGFLPSERVASAVRTGVRYVRYAPALQAVLVRTAAFVLFGSALWATLPFIARHEIGLNSTQYGVLLGSFGIGAVAGAWIIARLRGRVAVDAMVRIATVLFACLLVTIGWSQQFGLILVAMFIGGIAWMALMASLNTAAQVASPSWVRARAMAVYLLVFMGGFAAGGALWGTMASQFGIPAALTTAAIGSIVGIVTTTRFRLVTDDSVDLTPSMHWPEPVIVMEPHPDEGPVMITVEYRINPERTNDFSDAVHLLGKIRRRDGAVQWGIYRDLSDPQRHIETFIVASWVEHMRQHERVTVADRAVEDAVQSFHVGSGIPVVSHFIYSNGDGVVKASD